MAKPFFWAARGAWYLKTKKPDGKWTNKRLSEDEATAMELWRQMHAPATPAHRTTVHGVLSLYIEHLERRRDEGTLAAKTVSRRMNDLASFYARPEVDGLLVKDLRRHHATAWLADQSTWGNTTKYHAAEWLRQAFGWALDEGHIEENPLAKLKHEAGEPRQFCIDQELHDRLIDGTSDHKFCRRRVRSFKLVLAMLRLSGCRPGEVADMTIERVDFEKRQWVWGKHKTSRKTGRKRVVTCCPCLWTLTRIAAHGRESGPLVRPDYMESWTYDKIRRRFERLKKRIGAPEDCVAYSYRHASITDALKAGVDVATVAEMHGTSIQMLQRHYSHVIQDADHMQAAAVKAARYRRRG